MPSFSTTLEQAIHGALALANARRHELATLDHLLLALIDEPDAARVMKACSVNLDDLRKTLVDFIDDDLSTLVTDVEGSEAVPTAAFQRVIQRAAIHVQSSGRTEVTGANVLVAIFAERESNAAYFLQEQDMTRYDAVNFIAHGVAKDPSYGEARPVTGAEEHHHETPKAEAGEAKESALSKYCVDLNVKARKGDSLASLAARHGVTAQHRLVRRWRLLGKHVGQETPACFVRQGDEAMDRSIRLMESGAARVMGALVMAGVEQEMTGRKIDETEIMGASRPEELQAFMEFMTSPDHAGLRRVVGIGEAFDADSSAEENNARGEKVGGDLATQLILGGMGRCDIPSSVLFN